MASVDVGFLHVVDRAFATSGVTVGALFGPQHGFRSDVQDNMVETPHGDDQARRVPVAQDAEWEEFRRITASFRKPPRIGVRGKLRGYPESMTPTRLIAKRGGRRFRVRALGPSRNDSLKSSGRRRPASRRP